MFGLGWSGAAAAKADVVWPALYLETRLWSVWPILAGLIVEFGVLRWAFDLEARKALLVDVAMNTASALVGAILIPLAGIVWEVFPGLVVYKMLGIGTFNPGTWAATFLFAVLITSLIERFVIARFFKISVSRRRFLWLCAANAVSVGIAFASLFIKPMES